MKKINTRKELTEFFEQKRYLNKGVEVGSFNGGFASEILENWQGNLYLVDVWRKLEGDDYFDTSNYEIEGEIYLECAKRTSSYANRCFMLRMDSENASYLFNDNSLDFVYIDANHKYDSVKQDIDLWYSKVRKGGILAGHDYLGLDWYNDPNFLENKKDKYIWSENSKDVAAGIFGVNPAVDEFAKKNDHELHITNEWWGTWFIIK